MILTEPKIIVPNQRLAQVYRQTNLGVHAYNEDSLYTPNTDLWRSKGLDLRLYEYPPNNTYVFDRSRYNNHGTITGALWTPQGRSFGGDDLIDIDNTLTKLSTATVGTWEMWGKLTDATPVALNTLICFGDTDDDESLHLRVLATGKISVSCVDAGVDDWVFSTNNVLITDNTFFHLVLIQNGVSPILIVNGQLVAITFSIEVDKTTWFSQLTGLDNGRIGCSNRNTAGNAAFLTGSVGEVRFYNRALSTGEVRQNYLATKWRYQ